MIQIIDIRSIWPHINLCCQFCIYVRYFIRIWYQLKISACLVSYLLVCIFIWNTINIIIIKLYDKIKVYKTWLIVALCMRTRKRSPSWYSRSVQDWPWIVYARWNYIKIFFFMCICLKVCTFQCVQLHPISKSKCVFELAIQLYLLSISRCFLRKERITCPKTDRFSRFSDNFL